MNSLARDMEERKLAVALVRAYEGGADGGRPPSLSVAARAVGISLKRATSLVRRYKVRLRDRVKRHGGAIPSSVDPRTAATDAEAAERRAALAELVEGLSVRELAEMFRTSRGAVSRLLRAAGIERQRGRPASIDPAEVRRLREARFAAPDIAEILGCSEAGVRRLCKGRLPPRVELAAIVELRERHGYPWDEIGRHLQCHPDTAKKKYNKAKRTGQLGQVAAPGADQMLFGSVGCSEHMSVMVPSR